MNALRTQERGQRAWEAFVASPERWLLLIAVPVIILVLPNFLTSRHLFLGTITGTTAIVLYGLAALYGQTGILSIAHGGLWGVGAYTAAILHAEFSLTYWEVLPIAAVTAAIAAAVLAYPALRIRGHFYLITTFAFAELIRIILQNGGAFGSGETLGLLVLGGIEGGFFGIGLQSTKSMFYVMVALLFLAMAGTYLISISPLGRTFRGIRENEDLAESVGIDIARYKIGAFTLSGIFAGVAGVHYAFLLQHIEPLLFGAFAGIQMALMLLLGGALPLLGPIVGALTVNFIPELPIEGFGVIEARIIYGVALILLILLLPLGLVRGVSSLYLLIKEAALSGLAGRRPVEVVATPEGSEPKDNIDRWKGPPSS